MSFLYFIINVNEVHIQWMLDVLSQNIISIFGSKAGHMKSEVFTIFL